MEEKIYDILIVFCPGDPVKGRFLEVEDDKIYGKLYLGGEIRMKSATLNAKKAKWVILVGGSRKKVNGMREYIIKRTKDKKEMREKIIRIKSDPDTNGNLHAIKLALNFKDSEKTKSFCKRIIFLSNDYHMERIELFAGDILEFREPFEEDQFIRVKETDFYEENSYKILIEGLGELKKNVKF